MSKTIQSNQETARTYASQLVDACQALTDIAAANQDRQTTLQGNGKAHQVMLQTQTLASQISSAISTAANNLHSVASEFEAVDNTEAENFRG